MSNKYYYLPASLPYLVFERKMPISVSDFISECEKWLSGKELRLIKNANFNNTEINPDDPGIVKEWKRFNRELREELAKARHEKKVHAKEPVVTRLMDIFSEKNPLLMEIKYEKIRWDFIEEREFLYRFDLNWLILYLFKLQILERLTTFNKEKGIENFERLCESSPTHAFGAPDRGWMR